MSFGVYNQVIIELLILLLLLIIPISIYRSQVNWKWLGIALGLFIIHKVVLFLGVAGVYPDLIPGRYNWEGKIAAIILLLLAAWILFPNRWEEWGLRISQKGEARTAGIAVAIFTALVAVALSWFYFGGVKEGDPSDWLYQLSMPAIEEEIMDRGIMLLILDLAIPRKWKLAGVHWSWGAIIMVAMFYMTHVTRVDAAWNVTIIWGDFLPGFYGLLWMYIRLATGSLLLPILLHGWVNVIGYII